MKNAEKHTATVAWTITVALIFAAVMTFTGCGNPGDGGGGSVPFYTQTREAAPVFDYSEERGFSARATMEAWEWGNPLYEIYKILEDYTGTEDVADSNIYGAVHFAGSLYEELKENATELTGAPVEIASTFDFGNSETYTHGYVDTDNNRSFAYREPQEGEKHGLMTYQIDYADSKEYTVMQGYYNENDGTVQIDMLMCVEYESAPNYSLRMHLEGDTDNKTFKLKIMKKSETAYTISLAGYGVSKETEDSSDYFIFQVKSSEDGGTTWEFGNDMAQYYYFNAADATEENLSALDPLTELYTTLTDTVDPEGYRSNIPDTLFEVTDVPSSVSEFTDPDNMIDLP